MVSKYLFSDYFNIDELQKIQDLFSEATGVASIITEPDGTPITKPSGFCDLCKEIRKTEQGFKHCKKSDSIIGRTNEKGPNIHRCYSGGLLDAGASIIVEGNHIANWLIGQIIDEDQPIEAMYEYAQVIGLDEAIFTQELAKVKRMPKAQFEGISNFLYENAQMISRYVRNNLELLRELEQKSRHEAEIEKLNAELEEKNKEINKFFAVSSDLFSITDIRGNFYRYNKAWEGILGYTEEDLSSMHYQDYLHPDDLYDYYQVMKQIEETGKNIGFTPRFRHKDGSYRYLEWSCIKEGKYYYSADRDITGRIKTENALRESERSKAMMISNLPGIVYRCKNDEKWTMTFISEGCYELTGYRPEELLENNKVSYHDIIVPEHRERLNQLWKDELENRTVSQAEYPIITASGNIKWVWEQSQGVCDAQGNLIASEGYITDITERKLAEEEILYYSYHDQLTGLYNRRFYDEEIKKLDREANLPFSIIVGDVNGFKLFNDAFGHRQGDLLLKRVAEIIQSVCRASDIILRWSSDEFTILLPSTDTDDAVLLADRIRKECAKELINDVGINISFGWDVKRDPEQSIHEIMRNAEDRLYQNKIVESVGLRGSIIKTVIHTLHEKSPREEKHSRRVSSISQSIGKALQLPELELNKLKAVGLLHDIGKIGIEDSILDKVDTLTQKEYDEIKKHPDIGYRILNSSADMKELAEITLSHHERWDGKGYPKGLKGEEIPILSRIVSIADSYDAMTSDRPYRKALTKEETIRQILENSGTQFDEQIAKIFIVDVVPGLQH